jgi:hypothetical protein
MLVKRVGQGGQLAGHFFHARNNRVAIAGPDEDGMTGKLSGALATVGDANKADIARE